MYAACSTDGINPIKPKYVIVGGIILLRKSVRSVVIPIHPADDQSKVTEPFVLST